MKEAKQLGLLFDTEATGPQIRSCEPVKGSESATDSDLQAAQIMKNN